MAPTEGAIDPQGGEPQGVDRTAPAVGSSAQPQASKPRRRSSVREPAPDQPTEPAQALGRHQDNGIRGLLEKIIDSQNPELLEIVALADDATAKRYRRNRWSTVLQEIAKLSAAGVLAAAAFITSQMLGLSTQEGVAAAGVTIAAAGAGVGARRLQQWRQGRRRGRTTRALSPAQC